MKGYLECGELMNCGLPMQFDVLHLTVITHSHEEMLNTDRFLDVPDIKSCFLVIAIHSIHLLLHLKEIHYCYD